MDESGVNLGPGQLQRRPHYHEHYDENAPDVDNTDGMRRHKTMGECYNDHLKSL